MHFIDKLRLLLLQDKIRAVKEHKFLRDRKFRFDLAIPDHRIAVEYEGGIYNNGRHVRPAAYAKDCEKYNLATISGWRLLRYTTASSATLAYEDIQELMRGGGHD